MTPRDVAELVCLHRQLTTWVFCPHHPSHDDLANVLIHSIGTKDPETKRIVRAATSGRRRAGDLPKRPF